MPRSEESGIETADYQAPCQPAMNGGSEVNLNAGAAVLVAVSGLP